MSSVPAPQQNIENQNFVTSLVGVIFDTRADKNSLDASGAVAVPGATDGSWKVQTYMLVQYTGLGLVPVWSALI